MTILFLTHRLPYAPNRGDRIRAFHLLRFLATVGTVHVVSLAHDDDEWRHRNDLDRIAATTTVVRVPRWRKWITAMAGLATGRPLTHALLDSPALPGALRRVVDAARPDVVVYFCSGIAQYAFRPPLAGLPFVLDLVDVDSEKWRALATSAAWPKRVVFRRESARLAAFEGQAMTHATSTAIISERERLVLERVTGLTATVIPNGVDLTAFSAPAEAVRRPDVVFCGVFNYQPNADGAVWFATQVWPLVRQLRPDATLRLVGRDPSRAVRDLAGPSVEVTGTVDDVRPYLWSASVSVAPLQVARGLQNKVLEGLAAGLPAVVTPQVAEGLPGDIARTCRVADDAATFARHVIELLGFSDDARRRAIPSAALAELSWDRQLEGFRDMVTSARTMGRSA